MPLDYLVLAERYFLSSDKEFERVVLTDSQKALEVSKDYIFAGSFEDASRILEEALDQELSNPMIYYYIGYILNRTGNVDGATEYYKEGGKKKIDYVFPHRLEEITILEDVINTVPSSPAPQYLLGNVLFYNGRLEEGLEKWERAYELGLRDAVLCRNIGYARAKLAKETDESIDMYLEAINLDPQDFRLYIELDDIYCRVGRFSERLKLLKNVPEEARRGPLLARRASAYIDVGEHNKAIDMLLGTFFEPMEGYYGYWEIYVDALLAKGLTLLKSKKSQEAVKCFMDATEYPKNLGIGAPHPKYRKDVMQLYYAGLAYEKMRSVAAAEKIWHQALQRTPRLSSEHNIFKALILRKLGKEEESRSLIRQIMAATSADAHYTMGLGYLAEGSRDEGLKRIDEALETTEADRHARWVKDGILII
jgi:tetratricopeptide (TPR) repeat protein